LSATAAAATTTAATTATAATAQQQQQQQQQPPLTTASTHTHLVDGHGTTMLSEAAQPSSDQTETHAPRNPPLQQGAVGLVLVMHNHAASLQTKVRHHWGTHKK
jgi:hypothetical protein